MVVGGWKTGAGRVISIMETTNFNALLYKGIGREDSGKLNCTKSKFMINTKPLFLVNFSGSDQRARGVPA